jgi:Cytochrome P460
MKPPMWRRAALLLIVAVAGSVSAQSPTIVPFPRDYTSRLVKYAVVDRSDGMSRDLYVSREAVDALKHDPRLKELPAGVLFALDVHSARMVGLEPKTGAPRFEVTPEGRLVRSRDERVLHLMEKVQPGFGSQNWAFGGFDPVTAEPLRLQLPGDCLLCHQAAVMSEMTFSLNLLKRFVGSGSVQYRLCQQPGRQPCPFQ